MDLSSFLPSCPPWLYLLVVVLGVVVGYVAPKVPATSTLGKVLRKLARVLPADVNGPAFEAALKAEIALLSAAANKAPPS